MLREAFLFGLSYIIVGVFIYLGYTRIRYPEKHQKAFARYFKRVGIRIPPSTERTERIIGAIWLMFGVLAFFITLLVQCAER